MKEASRSSVLRFAFDHLECVGEIDQSTRRYDFEMPQAEYEAIAGAKTATRPASGNTTSPDASASVRRAGVPKLFLLHRALQRMLVLSREIHDLVHLGFGDLVGEYPAHADTLLVNV